MSNIHQYITHIPFIFSNRLQLSRSIPEERDKKIDKNQQPKEREPVQEDKIIDTYIRFSSPQSTKQTNFLPLHFPLPYNIPQRKSSETPSRSYIYTYLPTYLQTRLNQTRPSKQPYKIAQPQPRNKYKSRFLTRTPTIMTPINIKTSTYTPSKYSNYMHKPIINQPTSSIQSIFFLLASSPSALYPLLIH